MGVATVPGMNAIIIKVANYVIDKFSQTCWCYKTNVDNEATYLSWQYALAKDENFFLPYSFYYIRMIGRQITK